MPCQEEEMIPDNSQYVWSAEIIILLSQFQSRQHLAVKSLLYPKLLWLVKEVKNAIKS